MRLLLSIAVLVGLPIAALAQEARLVVVTAGPPPVLVWEQPPEIEVVRFDQVDEIVVSAAAPEPTPGWRLQGVDIRYHGMADAGEAIGPRTHSWQPRTPTRIPEHDWRSADAARIPYARTGSTLATQSWNAFGERFRASRIRYHGWGMR
jgi:hypothetical protein